MSIQKIVQRLRPYWHAVPPLGDFEAIDTLESRLGSRLPADYKMFLQWFSNGGEASLPGGYLLLFPVGELLERQASYEIDRIRPNLLLFGLEGDDVFAFDLQTSRATADYPVVRLSVSSRDPNEIEQVAPSFAGFLQNRLSRSAGS
jgi:hypothetical protein